MLGVVIMGNDAPLQEGRVCPSVLTYVFGRFILLLDEECGRNLI